MFRRKDCQLYTHFVRGCVPPLMGSGIYRSTQFAVFEAAYTYCDRYPFLKKEIPGTFGLQTYVSFKSHTYVCGGSVTFDMDNGIYYIL